MKESSLIRHIVKRNREGRASILSILMDVHDIRGYLSKDDLHAIAEETGASLVDVYAIVSSNVHFQIGGPLSPPPQEVALLESPRSDVRCHHCNHSLLDTRWLIDGAPSIKITVSTDFKHGWFRLSSLPNRVMFIAEHDFPRSGEAAFFCPHCHAQICSSPPCTNCGAPKVPMITKSSRLVPICSSPPDLCRRAPRSRLHGDDLPTQDKDRHESPQDPNLPPSVRERRIP